MPQPRFHSTSRWQSMGKQIGPGIGLIHNTTVLTILINVFVIFTCNTDNINSINIMNDTNKTTLCDSRTSMVRDEAFKKEGVLRW